MEAAAEDEFEAAALFDPDVQKAFDEAVAPDLPPLNEDTE